MGTIDAYRRAGEIAREARGRAGRIVREGMRVIELCERVESLIAEMGGEPAFPCNVCINHVAAHYTSPPGDELTIPPRSVVKVDIGVHTDGYIVDTAVTVALDPIYRDMVRVAEGALERGVEAVKANAPISAVSKAIQDYIETRGYKPIWNLTGHKIGRYSLHTEKTIPNVVGRHGGRLREGEVYALEPFITEVTNKGEVIGTGETYIFRFSKAYSAGSRRAKELLSWIRRRYRGLPFALRWIPRGYRPCFAELVSSKAVGAYPVLVEMSDGIVAQAEHTIVVTEGGCVVLT